MSRIPGRERSGARGVLLLSIQAAVVACGARTGLPDARPTNDAATEAGGEGGAAPDSGRIDSATFDSGSTDSTLPDSSPVDSGSTDSSFIDSGTLDTGTPDTGIPIDAEACDPTTCTAGCCAVLFGGLDGKTQMSLADTWVWNGVAWTLQTGSGPPAGN
jgi:hypothetical protein